jgi:hypothetical protein
LTSQYRKRTVTNPNSIHIAKNNLRRCIGTPA